MTFSFCLQHLKYAAIVELREIGGFLSLAYRTGSDSEDWAEMLTIFCHPPPKFHLHVTGLVLTM